MELLKNKTMKATLRYYLPFIGAGLLLGILFAFLVRACLEQRTQIENYSEREVVFIHQIDSLNRVILSLDGKIILFETAVAKYKENIRELEGNLYRLQVNYDRLLQELEEKTPEEVMEIFDSYMESEASSVLTELGVLTPMQNIESSVIMFYDRDLLKEKNRTLIGIIEEKDGIITTLESIIVEKDDQITMLYAIVENKDGIIKVRDVWIADMGDTINKLRDRNFIATTTAVTTTVILILSLIF